MKEFKSIIQAMEMYKRSKKHFPLLDSDIPTLQATVAKPIKAIDHRINQIKMALTIRDKLPPSIVDDYEARIDELETLKDYLEKSK